MNAVATKQRGRVGRDLTQGSILKTLLVFVAPIILTNLIQQLYGMVDLMIVGRFVGATGTVGVTTGGEFIDLLTPIATSFSTAGQIYIAQLIGAGEREKSQKAIGTLFGMMTVFAVVGLFLAVGGYRFVLSLLNCPEEAFDQARDYMLITALGLPFIFGYNAVCGVLRGVGESRRPLMFVIVAATVNIFTDIFFVAVLHMEAAGTAIATVLSQLGSFIAAAIFMYRRREAFGFELKLSYFKFDPTASKVILRLGVPMFIKTSLIHIAMVWVSANVNAFGLIASATNSVGNRLQKFVNMFTISMDSACASIIAQNLGARKHDRAKKTIYVTLGCCLTVATFFSIFSFFTPKLLFGIFTTDPAVLEMGVTYMRIMVVMYYLSAIGGSLQAMVTGSGFASLSFVIGVMDGIVCRIGISALLAYGFGLGVVGFFWGTALSRTIGCFISLAYFASGRWKTRRLLTE